MENKFTPIDDVPDYLCEEIENLEAKILKELVKLLEGKNLIIFLNALNLAYTDMLSYVYKDAGKEFYNLAEGHLITIKFRLKAIQKYIDQNTEGKI